MLIDTSGFYCLHYSEAPLHLRARRLFESAQNKLTHSYVLAEFVALAGARGLVRAEALKFVDDLVDFPDIQTIWVGEDIQLEAMSLLFERMDKNYSLADAVSFILMRRMKVQDALTTDRHFQQEGFNKLLELR